MKCSFKNADDLLKGIRYVAADLGFEVADGDADVEITVEESAENTVSVSLSGKVATITYGGGKARFFRGLAILTDWVKNKVTDKKVTQNPIFKTNGSMVDMSRNAVLNVESVKCMMRKMALMGLNMYMLYTEDTYEIEGRPYFGYLRGRYTKEEIKELDKYAMELGIELIPCIQVLGHLATHLRWSAAAPYKDTTNVLLVGADATYELIEDMIKTVSECFTTRRVHIGMDETHDLGMGAYIHKNGYKERSEIYFEHIERVHKIIKKYDLKPMMWSDMFFRLAAGNMEGFADYDVRTVLNESISKKVPKGIQQVFWDYYHADEDFYTINIEKHQKFLDPDTMFAGGVWLWSGHAPQYTYSLGHTIPALDACRKKGVKEVLATVWLEGSEGCLMMSLAGLAWYADYDYRGIHDMDGVRETLKNSCGILYDDIVKCEKVEFPHGEKVGVSRALLYNDPLSGLVDKHIEGMETTEYYKNLTKELESTKSDKGVLKEGFDVIVKLSSLLENKADFGVRAKKAYDTGDRETLKKMAKECDVIIEKVNLLADSHYESWMKYYKPQGWEIHDLRYGGLAQRFKTAKSRISDYLEGRIEKIAELEEDRLRLDGKLDSEAARRFDERFLWMKHPTISSANIK